MRYFVKKAQKNLIYSAAIIWICMMVPFACIGAIMNEVVATVNGEVITAKELEQIIRPLYAKYKRVYSEQETIGKIEKAQKEALDQLIDRKLVSQEAKRLNIEVSDKEIDQRLRQLKSQFEEEEMFYYALRKEGMNVEEVRDNLKEQIMVQKLTRQEVMKSITVTPLEVSAYYKEHIQKYQEPEMVSACHILVKKSSDHEAVQKKVDEIQDKLAQGVPCETVAKEYSEGPKASEGGDLGFFARGKMLPQIEEKAFQLNVGEISPVIESDIGYHIIQLKARKKERVKPLSEVYSNIQEIIQQGKIQEARESWLKELRKKAFIAVYI